MLNIDDTLRLEGMIMGENIDLQEYTFRWVVSSISNFDLLDLTDKRVLLGDSQRNLVITPGMLQPSFSYVRLFLIRFCEHDCACLFASFQCCSVPSTKLHSSDERVDVHG